MRFYLGIHHGSWLRTVPFPVFVSHVMLREYKNLPRRLPGGIWALDSGAFSEIGKYGHFITSPEQYADAARRYVEQIGGTCAFIAPQDYMCEPTMLARTGLSVEEHQRRTVESVLTLRALDPQLPFAAVLQGDDLPAYVRCVRMFAAAGIDLAAEPVVGLGSVCKRQHTDEIGRIVTTLADEFGINLHGFGVKFQGVAKYGAALASSDSMAWSAEGRHVPGCAHGTRGKNEANCIEYGLAWRDRLMRSITPWHQPGLQLFTPATHNPEERSR
jgi:hypothetical protein